MEKQFGASYNKKIKYPCHIPVIQCLLNQHNELIMTKKKTTEMIVELTPLEKVEALFNELSNWYGEADKKELRVAAKLLMVSLEQFSIHGGDGWHALVMEYVDTLHKDPEKFQKMLEANRGELKGKQSGDLLH